MKISEIEERFKATIDQHFKTNVSKDEEVTLWFIGGVLKAALHVLPLDNYYNLKNYCYEKHGYDPGGAEDGQITIEEYLID